MIFGARDVNLSHLYPTRVSYPPKNIVSQAVLVTTENIGKLALEFEQELRAYDNGTPFFRFQAQRGTEAKPQTPRLIHVRPDDWIVSLWDELHVYTDEMFRNTFEMDKIEVPEFPASFIEDVRTAEEARKTIGREHYKPSPVPRPIPLSPDDSLFDAGLDSGYALENTYPSESYHNTSGNID